MLLLAIFASLVVVHSAAATNSPNMRLDYSLNDTTSGRTHSDLAFWGNIVVAGNYDGFRVFDTDTHELLTYFLCRGPQNDVVALRTRRPPATSSFRTTRRRQRAT